MDYRETVDYLYSRLPVFTRIGKAAYKANLNNIQSLCATFGNPERSFRTIHVAGTNGKGSSSHYLASVLQEAGYKTGLFTSPHLKDFRERIRINGKSISKQDVVDFVADKTPIIEQIEPSFFELTVALAFQHFAKHNVDIAVIETGLGGRLDSTNVIIPELSLITNISFDHMDLLGETLGKIAIEKAGIIKPGVPVIIGERQDETASVFISKASREKSSLYFADDHVAWSTVGHHSEGGKLLLDLRGTVTWSQEKPISLSLTSELPGRYQQKNLKGVIAAIFRLRENDWKISDTAVENGIRNVMKNTGLHGRWETLSHHPIVICDTGHNEAGIAEVLMQLKQMPHRKLHIVWGMVADKDISTILNMLPKNAVYYFCKADIPRALNENELLVQAEKAGLTGATFKSAKKALNAAKKTADPLNDLVFVGGSTFVVAEVV